MRHTASQTACYQGVEKSCTTDTDGEGTAYSASENRRKAKAMPSMWG